MTIKLDKKTLFYLYFDKKLSMAQIAKRLNISNSKIEYWMNKYKLKRRSISEAIYVKSNPKGNPFKIKQVNNKKGIYLKALGIGLYWGEGTKANKHSVRISNSNPEFINIY